MSKFCYENLFDLLSDSKFVNNYKLFKSEHLSAWEIQTIFKDIIIFCFDNLCIASHKPMHS